jgi:glycosyltransferase involved in cell wall biosynthesis
MIARLLRDKGVAEYLAAAREVVARCPEARFMLVGAPDPNPSAFPLSEIERAVEEGVLSYRPFIADVRPLLAEAGVFVLPSYREGTSRATLEAMAMGRAVITTDAPGCRGTVIDGESGLLVPVADSAALVRAMLRLAAAPEETARMGRRSRALAEEHYDARRNAAGLMRVLGL